MAGQTIFDDVRDIKETTRQQLLIWEEISNNLLSYRPDNKTLVKMQITINDFVKSVMCDFMALYDIAYQFDQSQYDYKSIKAIVDELQPEIFEN